MSSAMHIQCRKCRHYYFTWDPAQPHGCRAMGFKSNLMPSAVVYHNSGAACLCFTPKQLDKTKPAAPKK